MGDWTAENLWRDFTERPLLYPLFRVYGAFMDIKRYEHMPFYFYPQGVSIVAQEDKILNFADWLVDAHEESRNPMDKNQNFYRRSVYVYKNFLRYQNATMCNVMFDIQAPRPAYDRLNNVVGLQNLKFYMAASATHILGFMYLSFFFRYRRVGFLPVAAIATAYYSAFESVNNILYKAIVDKAVLAEARKQGLDAQCQPCGSLKNRGHNYI